MAVLNQVCASWTDLAKQAKAFKGELQAIEADINKSLDSILNSDTEKQLAVQTDAALHELDSFFGKQAIGGLDSVLRDSGIQVPQDNSSAMSDLGFWYGADRYWKVNGVLATQNTKPVAYGSAGIGAGVMSSEQITTILGRDYSDPTDDAIQSMLQTAIAGTTYRSTPTQDDSFSVTGSRTVPGNIANIRELYRACNSDLGTLSSFLDTSYALGFGCVWSTSHVSVVQKPDNLKQSDFNADYVRKQLNKVLYTEDMDFGFASGYCFVREEIHLSYNTPKTVALELLRGIEEQYRVPVNSMALFARTVRFKPQEDSIGTCPLIVSRGCDPSKLTSTSYCLGLSVNGIYRVIDCSGDLGQKIVRTSYTVQDIVDSINEVFGDLLEVGTVGPEFYMRLRPGFGASGSITLFWVPGLDCSSALGLQNTIKETVAGKSLILNTQFIVPVLEQAKEVAWYGGAASPSQVTSSFQTTFLNNGNLSAYQKTALLTQQSYWDVVSEEIKKASSALVDAYGSGKGIGDAVANLESLLVYCDVSDFSYREYLTLKSALGPSLHRLLVRAPDITSLDTYSSKQTVRDNMATVFNELIANDGVVNTSQWASASLPLSLNYATAARLRLLYAESTEYSYVNEAYAEQASMQLQAYADGSVDAAQNPVISKTVSASTFQKILDGADDLLSGIGSLVSSDLDRVAWNVVKEVPGVSEIVGGADYLKARTQAIGDGIDAGVKTIQETIQDILSSVGLDNLNRKAIWVLLQMQECLESSQRSVNSVKSVYNATTKKIVALSNFNINFVGGLGFQSKYLSCYVTGTLNYQSTISLAKQLQIINDMADAFNQRLIAVHDMISKALDKILCLMDSLTTSLTGSMTFETTMQVGLVTMKANCSSYTQLGSSFDPGVVSHIMDLRRQVDFLLASMKLQQVTFKKHDQNLNATASAFTVSLEDTVNTILSKVTKCF